jgi:hypothetical protein
LVAWCLAVLICDAWLFCESILAENSLAGVRYLISKLQNNRSLLF